MACLSKLYFFKFLKGCLSQILLGSFLNTFSHLGEANGSERKIQASHFSHIRLDFLLDFNPFTHNVIKWPLNR